MKYETRFGKQMEEAQTLQAQHLLAYYLDPHNLPPVTQESHDRVIRVISWVIESKPNPKYWQILYSIHETVKTKLNNDGFVKLSEKQIEIFVNYLSSYHQKALLSELVQKQDEYKKRLVNRNAIEVILDENDNDPTKIAQLLIDAYEAYNKMKEERDYYKERVPKI